MSLVKTESSEEKKDREVRTDAATATAVFLSGRNCSRSLANDWIKYFETYIKKGELLK